MKAKISKAVYLIFILLAFLLGFIAGEAFFWSEFEGCIYRPEMYNSDKPTGYN